MNKLFNCIFWFKLFLSPFLLGCATAFIVYLYYPNKIWLSIMIILLAALIGIRFALKVSKTRNPVDYLSEIYSTRDIESYDEIVSTETKEKSEFKDSDVDYEGRDKS